MNQIIFNNEKFNKDFKTGYYLSTRKLLENRQSRLHRYVWEFYHGKISKNYVIHHIDSNKENNNIENLQLIKGKKHNKLHAEIYHKLHRKEVLVNLDLIRPMTKEWHASKIGLEWHKKHYEQMKEKLHIKIEMKCNNCSNIFLGLSNHSKVCSNKCKSALRRKEGKDNILKNCLICGKEFKSNKYAKIRMCSLSCRSKFCWNKKDYENGETTSL